MISAPLIVLGQILAFAFAAGLNLYATVLLVGIAVRVGWIAGLPPGVQGIDNPMVLGTAAALYFIEFLIDKVPHADTVWDIIHTIVRPIAAGVLVYAALGEASVALQIGGALLAATTALGAHTIKTGLRLILNIKRKKAINWLISLVEDIVAIAIAITALRFPVVALAVATAAIPITLLGGGQTWRASLLALRALIARGRGFFGLKAWRDTDALPRRYRSVLAPPPLGRGKPRVARAALRGVKGVGSYKNGWVVLSDGQPVFVYLSMLRPKALPLPPINEPSIKRGIWTDAVEFKNSNSNCTLFLLKDGPSPELAILEINHATS
ncbi:MAG TPA: DUF4126 domain-containing protein [Longimicrobiales bacterium]|nr:DUF4126 domain-containing protein [Longimicrobiales bacterium]